MERVEGCKKSPVQYCVKKMVNVGHHTFRKTIAGTKCLNKEITKCTLGDSTTTRI